MSDTNTPCGSINFSTTEVEEPESSNSDPSLYMSRPCSPEIQRILQEASTKRNPTSATLSEIKSKLQSLHWSMMINFRDLIVNNYTKRLLEINSKGSLMETADNRINLLEQKTKLEEKVSVCNSKVIELIQAWKGPPEDLGEEILALYADTMRAIQNLPD